MPHIFISYAKKDTRRLAEAIFESLQTIPDVTAWMDRSLEAGESWALQIQREIDRADYVIVLLSPNVNRLVTGKQRRSFVLNEIDYAQQDNKPIVPVLVQQTKMPVQLAGIQYIDLTARPDDPEPVIKQVCERFGLKSPLVEVSREPQLQPAQPKKRSTLEKIRWLRYRSVAIGLGAVLFLLVVGVIVLNGLNGENNPTPTTTVAQVPSSTSTLTDNEQSTAIAEANAKLTALAATATPTDTREPTPTPTATATNRPTVTASATLSPPPALSNTDATLMAIQPTSTPLISIPTPTTTPSPIPGVMVIEAGTYTVMLNGISEEVTVERFLIDITPVSLEDYNNYLFRLYENQFQPLIPGQQIDFAMVEYEHATSYCQEKWQIELQGNIPSFDELLVAYSKGLFNEIDMPPQGFYEEWTRDRLLAGDEVRTFIIEKDIVQDERRPLTTPAGLIMFRCSYSDDV
ncbi:MAG: toll/interleukin-1 receptor domain-containing protein [Anaerolineae bacterium]|nr:toll/interleukin-1 receptor domain-containing protein [Anaerolineae bacterium]